MAPTFIVCTGRCGSTALSNMLRLHPAILSLSEFFAFADSRFPPEPIDGERFWELLSVPNPQVRWLMDAGLRIDEVLYRPGPDRRFTIATGVPPILLTSLPHLTDDPETLFDEIGAWAVAREPVPTVDHYRALFAWLCGRQGRTEWVERSGASLPRTTRLAAAFPEARFVHLYRDGRDCAMSMSRHDAFRMMWMRGSLARALEPEPERVASRPAAPQAPFDREAFAAMPVPPADMGRFWSEMEIRAAPDLERLEPGRLLDLRYEALIADPRAELARLAAFIGVEADAGWLERASALARVRPQLWRELPSDQRAALDDACAPAMRLLYGAG
ncbi:MAG TPA: sulfotransferase [Candidatus Dormibacteraeota bacterium]|nr:sulfotransferase [Candidatus Dormibacteraeota bacterium]